MDFVTEEERYLEREAEMTDEEKYEMPDWLYRLCDEYDALGEKITKLDAFIKKTKEAKDESHLSCPIELLEKQLAVMTEYKLILRVRMNIEHIYPVDKTVD